MFHAGLEMRIYCWNLEFEHVGTLVLVVDSFSMKRRTKTIQQSMKRKLRPSRLQSLPNACRLGARLPATYVVCVCVCLCVFVCVYKCVP